VVATSELGTKEPRLHEREREREKRKERKEKEANENEKKILIWELLKPT